jgi:hypothetical protein
MVKKCKKNKPQLICNPKTGRWIDRNGLTGKQIRGIKPKPVGRPKGRKDSKPRKSKSKGPRRSKRKRSPPKRYNAFGSWVF